MAWLLAVFTAISSVLFGVFLVPVVWAVGAIGGGLWAPIAIAAKWFFSRGVVYPLLGGLAGSLAYIAWSLGRSERWLLERLHAEFVPKGELVDEKMALKDMAIAAGLPVAPAFYRIPSGGTNAFVFKAVGRRPVAGVTDRFLEMLTLDEQRAVFANLTARVVTGDTLVASAVCALMAPVEAWRQYRLEQPEAMDPALRSAAQSVHERQWVQAGAVATFAPDFLLLISPFGIALVVLGELLAAGYRWSHLAAAEKADADGMLLLKDPAPMLEALEHCVRLDNMVGVSGDALGQLFYCWTGVATNDELDPEWRRVARLREVLGVEGAIIEDGFEAAIGKALSAAMPPLPPRVAKREGRWSSLRRLR